MPCNEAVAVLAEAVSLVEAVPPVPSAALGLRKRDFGGFRVLSSEAAFCMQNPRLSEAAQPCFGIDKTSAGVKSLLFPGRQSARPDHLAALRQTMTIPETGDQ